MTTTMCNDGKTFLYLKGKDFNIWNLYSNKGLTEIKDRIYDAAQRIIIMGFDPDFFRYYKKISSIYISENGMFYKILLKIKSENKQIELLMPRAIFDWEMDAEKMHLIISTWMEYMSKILNF